MVRHEKIRAYPPMRKSVSYRDFLNRRGEFSKCLATEHRLIKDVKRLAQPRADKFVQNVGKVRKVKTFPDGLPYTSKWLVAEHRLDKGYEAACLDMKKFVCLPTTAKIG